MSEVLQRSAAYEFLGRLWMSEVDAELLQRMLGATDVRDAFLSAGGELAGLDSQLPTIEELAEDYCRLFLGPTNHLPPYQSVWIDGHFASDHSVDMQKWCEIVGFESTAIEADQLGVQLTVMSRIVRSQERAVEVDFYHQHLTWPKKLITTAAERAQTAFYRSVMNMTAAFLEEEGRQTGSAF